MEKLIIFFVKFLADYKLPVDHARPARQLLGSFDRVRQRESFTHRTLQCFTQNSADQVTKFIFTISGVKGAGEGGPDTISRRQTFLDPLYALSLLLKALRLPFTFFVLVSSRLFTAFEVECLADC